MNTITYNYPFWQRLVRTAFLILGLSTSLIIFASILISLVVSGLDPAYPLNASDILSTVILMGAFFLFSLIFLVTYIMFPSIHVRDTDLRIRTPIYQSNWLTWDKIDDVKEIWFSNRYNKLVAIIVKDISPLYAIIGFTQFLGSGKRAFVIHHTIDDYQKLLTTLREKRPDLFEGSPL